MLGWIRWWRRRNQEEIELEEELRAHLAIEVQERVAAGEDPAEAERAARRAFGNLTLIQEESRETWGLSGVQRFLEDARYGLRMLRRTPVWTGVICATLALGIGLSTAIFSVVYGVLLQPLPYPQQEQLVALWPTWTKTGNGRLNVNAMLWLRWRPGLTQMQDVGLTRPIANFNLTGDGSPERLQGARTSYNVPRVLGMNPMLGRVFTEEEQRADAKVAILSHGFWRRRFGGDPSVVGRKIQLNGQPFEVIGVMPPAYAYPTKDFELWTPLYIPPDEQQADLNYQYRAVGRLKPGVRMQQAQAELDALMHRLAIANPLSFKGDQAELGAIVEPLAESDALQVRGTLYVLLAAVGCLLLIGAMNLGVLLIARASARSREIAVRVALGATGDRLRRQLLAEVLPLAMVGIAGGTLLALWLLRVLIPYLPTDTPRIESIGLHGPVLLFAIGVALLVVLFAGLLPARMAARESPSAGLRANTRSVAGGGRSRNILVVAQVAVTVVLLFGGALFLRSFSELLRVQPGFTAERVLTLHLAVTRARFPEDEQVSDYYNRLIQRVMSVPGVTAAGLVNRLPMSGIAQTGGIEFEGRTDRFTTDWRSATPGYFEAMGIPLKRGRLLLESDRAHTAAVGLIDEKLARTVFGAESPVGKRFRIGGPSFKGPWAEIVGVVGHIRNDSPEKDERSQVYWPESQRTQDRGALAVRTTGPPELLAQAVIEQIHRENPEQPVYDVRTMDEWVQRVMKGRGMMTGLVSLFGFASLLLACLGLYGVVSYTADLRLREFGIRMALGADSGHVRGIVLRHAGKLAAAGAVLGLVLAWPAGQALRSLLFGVSSSDLVSWILAPAVLILVALLSGLGPARRAGRADPAVTLRAE
ncbi:ABC transporter permease [Paludibaculum fermentans]|uniref:ABC transporter permease n=1 Tax=Paludibaculum fermentans TaxID=1473598 RepID=UPI003EBA6E02